MLNETGLVTEVVGDYAIVQTQNQLACSSCKVIDTCGNGIVEKYLSGKVFTTEVSNSLHAKIGDKVVLQILKSSVTRASFIVYVIPLFTFITFALIASLSSQTENVTILVSLIGLFGGLFVTKFYNRKLLNDELYLPKMVSIVDTGASLNRHQINSQSNETINIKQI